MIMKQLISILLILHLSCRVLAYDVIVPMELACSDPIAITEDYLYNVFTLHTTKWPSGHRITVFSFPSGTAAQTGFLWDVLGLTSFRYQRKINKQIYLGNAVAPTNVHSFNEMVFKVATTPYSIGYIDKKVMINEQDSVRIINNEQ